MNWTSEQLEQVRLATERKLAARTGIVAVEGAPEPNRESVPTAARANRSNTGKTFEAELIATAGAYHSRRVAMLRKVDPPVRIIWIDDKANPGKKRQHVIFQPNPFLDFVGCWQARGGRTLLIEAKSTATHRLRFNAKDGLKEHQVTNMKTWARAGAATCVLWQWAGKVCLFTPQMLIAAEGRGDKSLVFESGVPVARGTGTCVWDFLAALESALPRDTT